ncbi:MAG: DUF488 domain-containing protein [Patescibacteria group bacterium]|nr:DUF488 domain-containing protein [Patescibacteria group bacterium]
METKIWTIGHSNRSIEEFIALLDTRGIQLVVDARTVPFSRANPQFNRPALALALSRVGIDYVWRGKNIGGLGENVDQEKIIEELVEVAADVPMAVMCSEARPRDCHRHTTLTPLFETRGVEVEHILWSPDDDVRGGLFDNIADSSKGRTPPAKGGN